MKYLVKPTLSIFFLLNVYANVFCQDGVSLKEKIAKEWKIKTYESFSEEFPPQESQQNDKMIFNSDMTAKIVEYGQSKSGK